MKSAFYDKSLSVEIRDVPVPTPGAGEVLIRTVVAGTNPKDWKQPMHWTPEVGPFNHGDDVAGSIDSVGPGVANFRPGDRVAAFHEMNAPHGSFAEFSIAGAKSTFHIPEHLSFEASMTAALGMYQELGLPLPWKPATSRLPLIVYGGASAVGAFVVKLAVLSNVHPIVAVAGNGASFVETLIDRSKGDTIVDYRTGNRRVVQSLRGAAGGDVRLAFDAVSGQDSIANLDKALASGGRIVTVLTPDMVVGGREDSGHAEILFTLVKSVYTDIPAEAKASGAVMGDREFGAVFFPFLGLGLAEGWFGGHPYRAVENGLDGLEEALALLQAGGLSAEKAVLRIEETRGVKPRS
ncbi:to quinone oxidoreductase [Geosmithia morbida]|uniref:To quinone oxidoreductase n=1 Tax=Geosmithia morbida TaxID=1094350 RepID=A0A9P5D2D8_9HYPO|nr:to quinone oxidoreductase [Geosmithia morbida]KAF4124938.1 to quinone oxidoreductase [Geosmithia morbida]